MGLSFRQTGKYTSEGHESARRRGLLTAGQAARMIRNETGVDVSARKIRPYSDEWHHSGFYQGRMGKTWFFKESTVRSLVERIASGKLRF